MFQRMIALAFATLGLSGSVQAQPAVDGLIVLPSPHAAGQAFGRACPVSGRDPARHRVT
ncbi:hypothetical protein TVNIR_1002 [Thioalkalivibrio nitratireducens DSM 14787]|uniref:Uncharacterized protein n=1 Tax=Thioalkalivibrio nitratireducens (strain DSM 14787 / UNIQEM 213 / ALEN2) TaxID=1255043 RepID=L0DWE1_THIND|nr:hypothetical protein [Thioalkalivibrio nitratireducens]AGA32686.1 hypothetical protein TVNIR_1002 [Thioalkalivibrio nitratireducens DSM 14787]